METPPNDRNDKGRSGDCEGERETVIVESTRKLDYLRQLGHPPTVSVGGRVQYVAVWAIWVTSLHPHNL